jgi:hypothetical protein
MCGMGCHLSGNSVTREYYHPCHPHRSQIRDARLFSKRAAICHPCDQMKVKVIENGKSPGEDNINSELYKYTSEEFKLRLLQFLNNLYTKNSVPNEWKNATVMTIFKNGDGRDPQNYRGSSSLNTYNEV